MKNGLIKDFLGNKRYYLNNELHREDGPAIDLVNGEKHWFIHGKRHREDGPAIEDNGNRYWYINGLLHREHAPAIKWKDGTNHWYFEGKPHCESGPALKWCDGRSHYYLHGELFEKEDYYKLEKIITIPKLKEYIQNHKDLTPNTSVLVAVIHDIHKNDTNNMNNFTKKIQSSKIAQESKPKLKFRI